MHNRLIKKNHLLRSSVINLILIFETLTIKYSLYFMLFLQENKSININLQCFLLLMKERDRKQKDSKQC